VEIRREVELLRCYVLRCTDTSGNSEGFACTLLQGRSMTHANHVTLWKTSLPRNY